MATPRSRRVLARFLVSALGTLVLAGLLPASTGSAEARPTLASVTAKIEQLQTQADLAVEDYDAAAVALVAARRAGAAAVERLARQRAVVEAVRARLSSFAASAYQSGGAGDMAALFLTGDPSTFLDRVATIQQIGRDQADAVAAFEAAAKSLAEAELAARQAVAQANQLQARMKARRDRIEQVLEQEKRLLGSLQAAERQRLLAAQQAADRAAAVRAPAPPLAPPAAGAPRAVGTPREAVPSPPVATTSGRGAVAVAFAYAQLGKPYSWGAAGPNAYDCSGLTMAAWGAAGVALPHSAGGQFSAGTPVSSSALMPGDLVFFGAPIYHVGIYIGSGLMISAPHTGTVVAIQSAFLAGYVGAVRP